MPKHFDSAIRFLQSVEPESWARFLGLKATNVVVCDTDLSTVTSTAGFVLLLEMDGVAGEHIECQASYDSAMGWRMVQYNVLARKKYNVPFHSTVLLLRPEADGPAMNGVARLEGRNGVPNLEFRFDVVRIWKIPAEQLFACGLGVLPLSFIADINESELPELVRRTEKSLKVRRKMKRAQKIEFWTAVKLLMGLRYNGALIDGLLRGVRGMKESVTYQAILKEGEQRGKPKWKAAGKVEGEREMLLYLGTQRFGAPSPKLMTALKTIR